MIRRSNLQLFSEPTASMIHSAKHDLWKAVTAEWLVSCFHQEPEKKYKAKKHTNIAGQTTQGMKDCSNHRNYNKFEPQCPKFEGIILEYRASIYSSKW